MRKTNTIEVVYYDDIIEDICEFADLQEDDLDQILEDVDFSFGDAEYTLVTVDDFIDNFTKNAEVLREKYVHFFEKYPVGILVAFRG